jgi:hypothetical protein
MQIMDGQPAARVWVSGGLHPVFAVEHRKDQLSDVSARSHQRALAQLGRQVLQQAMHDAKNLLCGTLVVRDLHAQRAFPRDAAEEKTRRHIGRDAELPRLEHDVPFCAGALQVALRSVQLQLAQMTALAAYLQQRPHQVLPPRTRFRRRAVRSDPPVRRRLLVQMLAYPRQPLRTEDFPLSGLFCRGKLYLGRVRRSFNLVLSLTDDFEFF